MEKSRWKKKRVVGKVGVLAGELADASIETTRGTTGGLALSLL